MELARRGFRLLLASSDSEFCEVCRKALRDQGLASQLMGSHHLLEGRPLKLARNFYDLVLSFAEPHPETEEMAPFLAPQGRVVRVELAE